MKQINDEEEEPGESDFCDRPRSGRPSSAGNDGTDALIKKRCIIINKLVESLEVRVRSVV